MDTNTLTPFVADTFRLNATNLEMPSVHVHPDTRHLHDWPIIADLADILDVDVCLNNAVPVGRLILIAHDVTESTPAGIAMHKTRVMHIT